jgi:hypothetical protein
LTVAGFTHRLFVVVTVLGCPYGLHATLPFVRLVVEATLIREGVPILELGVVGKGLVEAVLIFCRGLELLGEFRFPIFPFYRLEVLAYGTV